MKLRIPARRDTLGKDAVAGLVLGVESVPDGLAAGLLAGVNPLSGLYAYLFGTIGGSFFTSSAFMAVQATGAMAIVIADVPSIHAAGDSDRALFTLSVLTGIVMLAAGFPAAGHGPAVCVERGDGGLHQRRRRQYHLGPASQPHRVQG